VWCAFAPGRVNLLGEHTDHEGGLSLPFAIAQGVRVTAAPGARPGEVEVHACDLAQSDRFAPDDPGRAGGWRAFARGVVGELRAAGVAVPAARLEITGDLPRGAGLASSAALTVALCLALRALAGAPEAPAVELARLCSRVENQWVGARTGLLDQLAALLGRDACALRIDFRSLEVAPVALELGGWRLVTVASGQARENAASGYNERRLECERARALLGVQCLRDAGAADLARLPAPLARRARHVVEESARVDEAVAALRAGDLPALGALLDASHTSLRDLFECSTPALDAAVARLKAAGAAGARMIGGGFGGHVLGLLPPDAAAPQGARVVQPAAGARVSCAA
jgi:galactokinase